MAQSCFSHVPFINTVTLILKVRFLNGWTFVYMYYIVYLRCMDKQKVYIHECCHLSEWYNKWQTLTNFYIVILVMVIILYDETNWKVRHLYSNILIFKQLTGMLIGQVFYRCFYMSPFITLDVPWTFFLSFLYCRIVFREKVYALHLLCNWIYCEW